ncbi:hypothetical protein, partial [Halomonas sp. Ps84H-12]|uniref:hypothetical protein n=1 Tax=Halomonas sp. Ps84H-12 TaxID=2954501 RepID=UPI002097C0BC
VQVDRLSPIADGSLGSDSWRNTLNFQENTIRYLRFRAGLMNKAGQCQIAGGNTVLLVGSGERFFQADDCRMERFLQA